MPFSTVKLVSVATAVPPYCLEQRDVAAAAHKAFAHRYDDFECLSRVFQTSGIKRRYAARPIEWYFEPLGLLSRAPMAPFESRLNGATEIAG